MLCEKTDMNTVRMPCEHTEIRVTHLQAKEHPRLATNHQKLGVWYGTDSSTQPSEEIIPASTYLRLLAFKIITIHLFCLSYPVGYGIPYKLICVVRWKLHFLLDEVVPETLIK